MSTDYDRYLSRQFYILGIYQIAGGVLGIANSVYGFTELPQPSTFLLVLYLLIFLLFTYSILCGILLIKNRENAVVFSLINQYLQLLSISVAWVSFKYVAGFSFAIGLGIGETALIRLDAGLSSFTFLIDPLSSGIIIYINLIAVIALVMLYNIKRTITDRDNQQQLDQLGNFDL